MVEYEVRAETRKLYNSIITNTTALEKFCLPAHYIHTRTQLSLFIVFDL